MTLSDELRAHMKELASKGGAARAKKLTPRQRKRSAKKAAAARWKAAK